MKFLYNIFFNFFNFLNFKLRNIEFPENSKTRGLLFIRNHGKISIGSQFNVNSGSMFNPIGGDTKTNLIVNPGGVLEIGTNVGISNSTIFVTKSVIIQNNVRIGGGCKIWDTDHHSTCPTERLALPEQKPEGAPVVIKDSVWLGANVTVLKGVIIGAKSVVAAGSVVAHSIPENQVWGGNPAKFLKVVSDV